MPENTSIQHSNDVLETIFVGAALQSVSAEIMEKDVPLHTRHMASIDDLLMHVEDNDVDCAVIDQSRPTESRGIKLVLLASIKKVKHLIVVAPLNAEAEISSMDGVHKVLSSPVSREAILTSVLEQTRQTTTSMAPASNSTAASQPAIPEQAQQQAGLTFAKLRGAASTIVAIQQGCSGYNWSRLGNRLLSRQVMATVASVFVGLGTLAALSLVSDRSVLMAQSAGTQAMTEQAESDADKVARQPLLARRASGQTETALRAAALSRHHAASSIEGSLRTINLEIVQQLGLREEVLTNISRLNAIVLDLSTALKETDTGQSDRSGSLARHTGLAKVKIELALQELELSKIDNVLENLNLLKTRINPPDAGSFKLADIGSSGISE